MDNFVAVFTSTMYCLWQVLFSMGQQFEHCFAIHTDFWLSFQEPMDCNKSNRFNGGQTFKIHIR